MLYYCDVSKGALYSRYAVNTTYTDVGSADIAGANICHPCRLDCSIHATVNLEYRDPFSYMLLHYCPVNIKIYYM